MPFQADSTRTRLWLVAAGAAIALVGATSLVACCSTKKSTIETRLLALPRNARIRAHGLQHRKLRIASDGGEREVEVTYWHVPAKRSTGARPLVLIHGTPSSLFTWSELVLGDANFAGLSEDFDVWAIDVVGHGTTRSAWPPYSFQRCADWVAGCVRGLGLERVILVGNSYGGEFAWRAALDHPELVEKLVLIDSAGIARRDGEWLPEEVKMREMSLAKIGWLLNSQGRVRAGLQPHFRERVSDGRVDEVFWAADNRDNWHAMIDLARDEQGARQAELAHLARPTLLAWGAQDVAYPPARFATEFQRLLPNAELRLIPQCGHYPQEERPAELAALLREFVARAH